MSKKNSVAPLAAPKRQRLTRDVLGVSGENASLETVRTASIARGRATIRDEKASGSPVSEVDLDVDRMLRARLAGLLPDAGWLSEETADNASRLAQTRVWVVDPIDGTRDYIRGREGWAVSIALVDQGRPVLAVLDAPARRERWRASAGAGASRNGVALAAGGRSVIGGRARPDRRAAPRRSRSGSGRQAQFDRVADRDGRRGRGRFGRDASLGA